MPCSAVDPNTQSYYVCCSSRYLIARSRRVSAEIAKRAHERKTAHTVTSARYD